MGNLISGEKKNLNMNVLIKGELGLYGTVGNVGLLVYKEKLHAVGRRERAGKGRAR